MRQQHRAAARNQGSARAPPQLQPGLYLRYISFFPQTLGSNLIAPKDCLPNLFSTLQIARAMGKVRIEMRITFFQSFCKLFL
jgi:hypothetical protein